MVVLHIWRSRHIKKNKIPHHTKQLFVSRGVKVKVKLGCLRSEIHDRRHALLTLYSPSKNTGPYADRLKLALQAVT